MFINILLVDDFLNVVLDVVPNDVLDVVPNIGVDVGLDWKDRGGGQLDDKILPIKMNKKNRFLDF